jgi:hypothetical protein
VDRSECKCFNSGVGDGNRTRNVRSHSPVLCRLSYSHRVVGIIATSEENFRRWRCLRSPGRSSGPVETIDPTRFLPAADADVFKSHGAETDGVEQVLRIDD